MPPMTLPPGTPKDRVLMLRKAFQDTLRDPAFLAEAEKAKLDVDPVTGEDVARVVEGLFKLEAPLVARLKTILLD